VKMCFCLGFSRIGVSLFPRLFRKP
jgi:hypothetical protein